MPEYPSLTTQDPEDGASDAFKREIHLAYHSHGYRHLLPFIGGSFADSLKVASVRVAAIGLNSYISDLGTNEDIDSNSWASWWKAGTFSFHRVAYSESHAVAAALLEYGALQGRELLPAPASKAQFYATNFVKVYTDETYKRASSLTDVFLDKFRSTWAMELDLMAKYHVFPNLIVVFGAQIWQAMWQALCPEDVETFPHYETLRVVGYHTSGDLENSTSYHHANRIDVEIGGITREVFLVRLDHPSMPTKRTRTASWLVADPDFRKLAKGET